MPELKQGSDLIKLAVKAAEKNNLYTSIEKKYRIFRSGKKELVYTFYQSDFPYPVERDTPEEIQQAMENIINPPEDAGVKV